MASKVVIPTDWTKTLSSSDHTDVSSYGNALTNASSTTYGTLAGDGWILSYYLTFNPSDIPSRSNYVIDSVTCKIKAVSEYTESWLSFHFVSGGVTYDGGSVVAPSRYSASQAEIFTLSFPSNASYSLLQNAESIYIETSLNSNEESQYLLVFGAELDIVYHDAVNYKIFNLILPSV